MATEPPVEFKDLPDTSTPLNAATLNAAMQGAYNNAVEAEASASLAQQYAEQAAAPADDQIALLMATPGSLTRQQLAPSIVGTYAARPAATSVPPRTLYYASDLPESYLSDGASWRVVSSGGVELAYAELTSSVTRTYTGAAVDVPGLTVTWVQTERPVVLEFSGLMSCGASTPLAWLRFFLGGSTLVGVCGTTASQNVSVDRRVKLSTATHGLTPGVSYTVVGRLDMPFGTVGTSTAMVNAATTNPSSLRVVTT